MGNLSRSLLVHQRLGFVGLSIFLLFMTTTAPLSMDMFSPSIPQMTEDFNAPSSEVTLTVTIFFIFYAVGMLICGTISDKFGRKPVLIITMALFTAGSALCALSSTLPMLIGSRVVQAIGGGGGSAVAIALLKDVFSPAPREKFLMFMSVIQVIAPVVAPIMGAWIITFATWHMVFWVLSIFGLICLVFSCLFNETLPKESRLKEPAFASYKRMGIIFKDKAFVVFMIATIMPGVCFSAYLAVGSYIYIDQFGCSETVYSYFFAATALISVLGPMIYTAAVRRISRKTVLTAMLCFPLISVVILGLVGHSSPFAFVIAFIPIPLASAAVRPAVTSILLQQHDDDAGSSSGIINFVNTIGGAVGMYAAALFDPDFINGIIFVALASSILSLLIWIYFHKSSLVLKGY